MFKKLYFSLIAILISTSSFAQTWPHTSSSWETELIKQSTYWDMNNFSNNEMTYSFIDPTDGYADPTSVFPSNGKDALNNNCAFKAIPSGLQNAVDNVMNAINLQQDFDLAFNPVLEDTIDNQYVFQPPIRFGVAWGGQCVYGAAAITIKHCDGRTGANYWSCDSTHREIKEVVIIFNGWNYNTGGGHCASNMDVFDYNNADCTTNETYNGLSYVGGPHSAYVVPHEIGHALGLKHPNNEVSIDGTDCSDTNNANSNITDCNAELNTGGDAWATAKTDWSIMATGSTFSITGGNNSYNPSGDVNYCYGRCAVDWSTRYVLAPYYSSTAKVNSIAVNKKEPAFYLPADIDALIDLFGAR